MYRFVLKTPYIISGTIPLSWDDIFFSYGESKDNKPCSSPTYTSMFQTKCLLNHLTVSGTPFPNVGSQGDSHTHFTQVCRDIEKGRVVTFLSNSLFSYMNEYNTKNQGCMIFLEIPDIFQLTWLKAKKMQ